MRLVEYGDRWINPEFVSQVRVYEYEDGEFGVIIDGSDLEARGEAHGTREAAVGEAKIVADALMGASEVGL